MHACAFQMLTSDNPEKTKMLKFFALTASWAGAAGRPALRRCCSGCVSACDLDCCCCYWSCCCSRLAAARQLLHWPGCPSFHLQGQRREKKKTKTLTAHVQLKAQGSYIPGMPVRVLLFLTTSYQLDTSPLHISKTYDAYNVAAPNKWGSPFRDCVGVWKSVRGLSLQEGALLSVLLRLVRFSCRLVEAAAELGTSLNICKSQTAPVSTSLTCSFLSISFQKS